jgi:acetyl-CoA/propionyl-CoA carboxylase biotin carboxyl carrier protein
VDSGVETGDTISGNFDSMIAKLIVTGSSREEALERSRRALSEIEVLGLPTVLPFHRKIVNDPAFISADGTFGVYTRWIETEWDNDIEPWAGLGEGEAEEVLRNTVVVEVEGKRIEVSLPSRFLASASSSQPTAGKAPKRKASTGHAGGATGSTMKAPMQSTVVKLAVAVGDKVIDGDLIIVLEAMKMEQPMTTHRDGVIKSIAVSVGETIPAGTVLVEFED